MQTVLDFYLCAIFFNLSLMHVQELVQYSAHRWTASVIRTTEHGSGWHADKEVKKKSPIHTKSLARLSISSLPAIQGYQQPEENSTGIHE